MQLKIAIAFYEGLTVWSSLIIAVSIGLVGLVVYPVVVEEMWINAVEM